MMDRSYIIDNREFYLNVVRSNDKCTMKREFVNAFKSVMMETGYRILNDNEENFASLE